jgi:hypothetical protein
MRKLKITKFTPRQKVTSNFKMKLSKYPYDIYDLGLNCIRIKEEQQFKVISIIPLSCKQFRLAIDINRNVIVC